MERFHLKASSRDATFIEAFSPNRDQRAVFRMQEDGSWDLVADDLDSKPWFKVVLECERTPFAAVHEEDSSIAQKIRAWLPYITGGAIVAGVGGYVAYKMISGGDQKPQEKRDEQDELLLAGAQ